MAKSRTTHHRQQLELRVMSDVNRPVLREGSAEKQSKNTDKRSAEATEADKSVYRAIAAKYLKD